MDENSALEHKGCFSLRLAGSDRMSSLLIVGEGDVLCGNTVWQERQKERQRKPRIVFGRPTTLTCKHINLHLYYLLAYGLGPFWIPDF